MARRNFKDILLSLAESRGYTPSIEEIKREINRRNPIVIDENQALTNLIIKKGVTFDDMQIEISKELFQKHIGDDAKFSEFLQLLRPEQKNKFLDLSHFYYFYCAEKEMSGDFEAGFQLIIMTSTIEALMSNVKHKDFYTWFCSEYVHNKNKKNLILSKVVENLWQQYKKEYGATKKITNFFEQYLDEKDKKKLISGFKNLNNDTYFSLTKIAKMLYGWRSDFVHKAEIVTLRLKGSMGTYTSINGKPLKISIGIESILEIFEKAFINYFQRLIKK